MAILAEKIDTFSKEFYEIPYATIKLSQNSSHYNYVQSDDGSSHRADNELKLTFTSKVELIKPILLIIKWGLTIVVKCANEVMG